MDTITHGIAGALIGKAYFARPQGSTRARVGIAAVTIGAMFPDGDFVSYEFSRNVVAMIEYHRGFTHSFLALPLFAVLLAWATRWVLRRRGRESPSMWFMVAAYGVGLASHIVLDAMTSYGTRIWNPIAGVRVAWDLLFIIDFTFTALVLVPQVAAWVSSSKATNSRGRGIGMWALFSAAAWAVWLLCSKIGLPFSLWMVALIAVIFAGIFLLPAFLGHHLEITRERWCRVGVYATLAYLAACGVQHHRALQRVSEFANGTGFAIDRVGALPSPPSLFVWNGLIRTPAGVYISHFDLRDKQAPDFVFVKDSAPNDYVARAVELKDVQTYWNFARFPMIHTERQGDREIVDFGDLRFRALPGRRVVPLTLQVIFDRRGNFLRERWLRVGDYLSDDTDNGDAEVPQGTP
jgi:membrane-bound metal-dependent hydrolase YbcI (DUF457 family)